MYIVWISSYMGIAGNERVDTATNQASEVMKSLTDDLKNHIIQQV